MVVDDLRHAWAIFGLRPGTSVADLRRRYRALAKQWHPDRYTNDPQGQAEASSQMRILNFAYERLLTAAKNAETARAATPRASSPGAAAPQRGRLSREELDRMIEALGSQSYVEGMLDSLPYADRAKWLSERSPGNQWEITESVVAGLVFAAGCLVMLVLQWRGVDAMNSKAWYAIFAAPVIVAVVWQRKSQS